MAAMRAREVLGGIPRRMAARVEVGRECDGCGGEWADAWAGPRRSGFPGSYITRRGWGVAAARAPLILVDF